MPHLTLNCPRCRRRLVHVPLDGLTLYFWCHEHGSVILRPLVVVDSEEMLSDGHRPSLHLQSSDAA
jgi:hypothetical protein